MIVLELFVLLLGLVVILYFTTEVFIPFVRGTKFFPHFRKATPLMEEVSEAERNLEETTELVLLKQKLVEINRRKAELEGK